MGFRTRRQRKGLSGQPFSLYPGEVGDLFHIPCERRPDHIDRISGFTFVSALVHPVVILKMANDRFNLDPLLECLPEPGCPAVRMGMFPLLGNRHPFCAPSPPAVLLFLRDWSKPLSAVTSSGHRPMFRLMPPSTFPRVFTSAIFRWYS